MKHDETPGASADDKLTDTEGHGYKSAADAETPEGEDTTEGHTMRSGADAESAEGDQDAEGHGYKWADAEKPEEQDAEGHALRGS